jgi:hypothetical protein
VAALSTESEARYSRLLFPQMNTLDVPKNISQDIPQTHRFDVDIVSAIASFLVGQNRVLQSVGKSLIFVARACRAPNLHTQITSD